MQDHKLLKTVTALLFAAVMAAGMAGHGFGAANSPAADAKPVNVVWYPNESSNTHDEVRAEVGRLIERATGRKVEHKLTTEYTIAIESISSGAADIAMAMGAVGYIEAQNRNPRVGVLFVNGDQNGKLDEAKYFSWLCVNTGSANSYRTGGAYSIDNIKGKKMSFVSNSSTSGFRVPTSAIVSHFANDKLNEDDLLPDGKFFKEVFFGGSHQGSAVNLVSGNVDVAAFCDIELAPYIELKSGQENTVGAVYGVKTGADAPFGQHAGKEFAVISCTPVFNGPNAYNPRNLSDAEIEAVRALFTSDEVANNKILFYDDAGAGGAVGLYKTSSSKGYVRVDDSWYDPYRNM
ncbi:MAG: PhnD/SsuA/transferrin family substrate-binding protein [Gracilibacteraceae bacterium]|jgi:phosphonate transport system substrate-binding protein|nr:PhnD/SsuA/transferrin family substrate-binding protein [Gracilibacteraceae bacterium]